MHFSALNSHCSEKLVSDQTLFPNEAVTWFVIHFFPPGTVNRGDMRKGIKDGWEIKSCNSPFSVWSVSNKGLIEGRDLWLKVYQSKLLIKYLLYIQPWSLLRTQEKVGCCKLIWEESFYFILLMDSWFKWVSLIAQLVKNPPAVQKTPDLFLGWEEPLGRERLPTPVSMDCIVHGGCKELDKTEWLYNVVLTSAV